MLVVMPRRTKILATLGPATDRPGVLDSMIEAGMDGARVNCSHGTAEDWHGRVRSVRAAARAAGRHVAVLVDLQGPKIRLAASVEAQSVAEGDRVRFCAAGEAAVPGAVAVEWPAFLDAVTPGQSDVIIGDGLPRFHVEDVVADPSGRYAVARCTAAGKLSARKGAAVTHAAVDAPALTAKDLADLVFACEIDASFVALSFVRSAADVEALRSELQARGCYARIVAKVEKVEAIDRLDEIIAAADAVMVARGDLGVEAGVHRIARIQKRIIQQATDAGKLVITATQMLESMIENATPTRAESTDVANAVMDGTSAVMLSAETAMGAHPIAAVREMAEIARDAEQGPVYGLEFGTPQRGAEAVMQAAAMLAQQVDAGAILVPTTSGGSVRATVKYRPLRPVVALALSDLVADQLALEWGVIPARIRLCESIEDLIGETMRLAQTLLPLDGRSVVLTYGPTVADAGGTNLIAVKAIGEPASP